MSKPTRLDCLRFLADHISETDIVVPALGETEALWHALSGGRPGNFYIRNGMSMPTSVGLGLAVAQPSRHVWVLEGDGGMLMNLGSLSTIAAQGPRNLRIIIFVNRQYQASGGQRLSASVDFELLARGSGLQHVASVHAASDLAKSLDVLAASSGPALLVCEIEPAPQHLETVSPVPHPQEFKRSFARFLGLD